MILGNSQQQEILKNWLERDNGTFLLYGPEGVGKFSFCLDYLKEKGWEKVILNTEDKLLKIESARLLTSLSYYQTEKRVILINDVHKFQKQSQNTLLKTLEESPTKTIFILVTHELNEILPTIRSRSLMLKFNLLSPETTIEVLKLRNYNLDKIKFILEVYPGQPGKIISFLENPEKLTLVKKFFLAETTEKLLLLEELKKHFTLKEILSIYLLIKMKQVKKRLDLKEIQKIKETLNLYADADYNLNFELQLANLILNHG